MMAGRTAPPAIVTRIVPSREADDCCVTSIAMYAGRTYEDVLREIVIADPKARGRDGLKDRQIRRVLKALGSPARWRTRVQWAADHGLVRFTDHLALLRNGLIVEDGVLWDHEDWRRHHGYGSDARVWGIFVSEAA